MSDTADIPDSLLQATIAQLSKHAPFDQMDRAHLAFMARRLKLSYHPTGSILLRPKQGTANRFFIIKQGAVAGLQDEAQGAQWQLVEGECFPLGALLSRRPVSCIYQAIADTFCYELSDDDFAELIRISQPFHDFCTRRIANLLEQSQRAMQADYSTLSSAQQSLNTPLASLIRRAPVTCTTDQSIHAVLQRMQEEHVGSMVIMENSRPVGIFTLHDLLERVALKKMDMQQPISSVMSHEPVVLGGQVFAHEAALAMARHGIRHVLVAEGDTFSGVVSEKDLFSLQRVGLTEISTAIRNAGSLESLQQSALDVHRLGHVMLAQGVSAYQLTQIITTLNDLLTGRIIELELEKDGLQDMPLCWLAMGSEGRSEQTFSTDQDNAIIFPDDHAYSPAAMREKLLPVTTRINQALDQCGFPLCKGGVMASNPKWCLSLSEWREVFRQWVEQGDPEALLNASIFFDFRPIFGKTELAESLRKWLAHKASNTPRFLQQMASNALRNRPPLGLVRDFVTTNDGAHAHTLDLKLNGATPFVDAARIFALAAGISETNTALRLLQTAKALGVHEAEASAWSDAFHFIQLLRLRHQHSAASQCQTPDNFIDPEKLNGLDRRILKEAFRQSRKVQSRLALDYQL